MPNPPADYKLYEVAEKRVIRLGEPDGLVTFTAKSRIWLTSAEAALHGDSIVLIYPPELHRPDHPPAPGGTIVDLTAAESEQYAHQLEPYEVIPLSEPLPEPLPEPETETIVLEPPAEEPETEVEPETEPLPEPETETIVLEPPAEEPVTEVEPETEPLPEPETETIVLEPPAEEPVTEVEPETTAKRRRSKKDPDSN